MVPIDPIRALDTRLDGDPVRAGSPRTIKLVGAPRRMVAASLTITAVNPSDATYLTVWSGGTPQPPVSNLNVEQGGLASNGAIVAVNGAGEIQIATRHGAVDVIVDVTGWFVSGSPQGGARYVALPPSRLVDTRSSYPIPPGETVFLNVTRREPYDRIQALNLNVTASGGSEAGYLAAAPADVERRPTSALVFARNATAGNTVVAKLGPNGRVGVFNGSPGWVHEIVDLHGVYVSSQSGTGGYYTPTAPSRLHDSRTTQALTPEAPQRVVVGGKAGVPSEGVASVVLVVTAVGATQPSELTVGAAGQPRPRLGQLSIPFERPAANLVTVPVGADGAVEISLSNGASHVIVDVVGWFETLIPTPLSASPSDLD